MDHIRHIRLMGRRKDRGEREAIRNRNVGFSSLGFRV